MRTAAYIPSERSQWLQLARSRTGRLFRKRILSFGEWQHPSLPGEKLVIDRKVGQKLVENFHRGVVDIVQVPVVGDKNDHTEDPLRNIGEVVDLTVEDSGVFATIDVRKDEAADQLGKTLLGASAFLHLNYSSTKDGRKVGPALLHVAVTNRPYISDLGGFREVIAAAARGANIVALRASNFREETTVDDEDEVTIIDVAESVIELSQETEQLAAEVTRLTTEKAMREEWLERERKRQERIEDATETLALAARPDVSDALRLAAIRDARGESHDCRVEKESSRLIKMVKEHWRS